MCKRTLVGAALLMCLGTSLLAQVAPPAGDGAPKTAANRIIAVTVYQGTALVTREVEVGEGSGLMEFVVSPLPPQTIDSSLYTESSDGIRVLTTRYRNRCQICGRPRAYYREFGLCRICFRKMAHQGQIPGVKKSSW